MDPTLRTRTLSDLKERFAGLSPQMRRAAKYVLDHPAAFGLDPVRDTAQKASVSTYTLINLAKSLGFDGFESFRAPFRQALLATARTEDSEAWISEAQSRGDMGRVMAEAAQNSLSIVTNSLERLRADQMEEIVEMLFSARHVFITAVRSSFAMAYYLHYAGRMALPSMTLIPHHHNSAIDDLIDADERDVLIALTMAPYSKETVRAAKFAQAKGLKLLLISDSEVVSADLAPEHTLVSSILSTHRFGCFAGITATLDVLVGCLMHRGGAEAIARIGSYETLRLETNAYWPTPQKKH